MADPTLDSLVDYALRPLSGDVGEDLAQTSSIELIQIRNQFNDSSRDFRLLYENGRMILAEKSKDLWAAWALVGGLLWSKQFEPPDAFAASCKLMHGLCRDYWGKIYPESRGLRSTLLMQIAKWWNTFVVRCAEGTDKESLKVSLDELVALQQCLLQVTEGNTDADKARVLPILGTLPQIIKALQNAVGPAAAPAAAESIPPSGTENGQAPRPEVKQAPAAVAEAPRASSLDAAFQEAVEKVRAGRIEEALTSFQVTLKTYGDFADQYRGRVMLGELYLKANLPTHAKRVLQYTHDELDKIRLSDWEPKLCSRLWASLIQAHQKTKEEKPNEKLLAELFASLCRIDPATAAALEPIRGTNN